MFPIRPPILELFNETLKSSIYTLNRIGEKDIQNVMRRYCVIYMFTVTSDCNIEHIPFE